RNTECREHASCLGTGFLQLALGIRVSHDSAAGPQLDPASHDTQGTDQNIHVHAAVAPQEPERTRIRPPADTLQLRNDLHASELGHAGDCAAWKHRAQRADRRYVGTEFATDIRYDVVHVCV